MPSHDIKSVKSTFHPYLPTTNMSDTYNYLKSWSDKLSAVKFAEYWRRLKEKKAKQEWKKPEEEVKKKVEVEEHQRAEEERQRAEEA